MRNIKLVVNNDLRKEKEKFLIKDKNGNILKKSEDLNQLINKTSWNNLRLVK